MSFAKPRPATQEDINSIIEGFAHTAEYMEKAGGDGIQVHAAHGYLLAQFLSPDTNKRTDSYGGPIENRARIITEIAKAVRARTGPNFVMGIKLNSTEFQDKDFQAEEAKKLCKVLEDATFDFVEISGGSYEDLGFLHNKRDSTKRREAYFLEFAEMMAPNLTKTKSYLVGGLRTVGAMVQCLNVVDAVALGRPLCQEPRLCGEILAGRVKGAIIQKGDPTDYLFNTIAAGKFPPPKKNKCNFFFLQDTEGSQHPHRFAHAPDRQGPRAHRPQPGGELPELLQGPRRLGPEDGHQHRAHPLRLGRCQHRQHPALRRSRSGDRQRLDVEVFWIKENTHLCAHEHGNYA